MTVISKIIICVRRLGRKLSICVDIFTVGRTSGSIGLYFVPTRSHLRNSFEKPELSVSILREPIEGLFTEDGFSTGDITMPNCESDSLSDQIDETITNFK